MFGGSVNRTCSFNAIERFLVIIIIDIIIVVVVIEFRFRWSCVCTKRKILILIIRNVFFWFFFLENKKSYELHSIGFGIDWCDLSWIGDDDEDDIMTRNCFESLIFNLNQNKIKLKINKLELSIRCKGEELIFVRKTSSFGNDRRLFQLKHYFFVILFFK